MNAAFKIETGIPLSPKMRDGSKYPFADMDVGDSFFCADIKQSSIAAAISVWARRNAPEKKFATRKVEGGVRIWRTA